MVFNEEKSVKSTRSMLEHAKTKVGIQINETYCNVCTICSSVCPFEAISTIKKTGEVKLDIEKCARAEGRG